MFESAIDQGKSFIRLPTDTSAMSFNDEDRFSKISKKYQ